jgi:Regulator of chromosome condensation (RCC1) repeat
MPKAVDEDRARRKEALEQKRLARKAFKDAEEEEKKRQQEQLALELESNKKKNQNVIDNNNQLQTDNTICHFIALPDDAMHVIYSMLSSVDLGRLILTCKHMNITLTSARLYFLLCRLSKVSPPILHHDSNSESKQHILKHQSSTYDGWCGSEQDVRDLLEDSIIAGGDTGRIIPRGKFGKKTTNEFISYARFIEDAICGYNHLSSKVAIDDEDNDDDDSDDDNNDNNKIKKNKIKKLIYLPKHVQGRFVSCSPEHTVCRVGGDGTKCGAGGSGVATWGIGRRGQLGHGKREDERYPKRIISGTTTTTTTTNSNPIKLGNTSIISSTKTSIDSP